MGEKARRRRQGQGASVVVFVIVFVFVIAFAFVFVIVFLLDRSNAFFSCPFNGLCLCGREGKEAKGKVRALLSPRWQLLHSLGFVSVMWTNKYVTLLKICISYVDKQIVILLKLCIRYVDKQIVTLLKLCIRYMDKQICYTP